MGRVRKSEPAGVEPLDVERRHLPARRAEQHEHPAGAQRGQRRVEGVLADAVVGDGDPAAAGEPPHLAGEVVDGPVVDDVLGAHRPSRRALVGPTGRRDDRATAGPHHLHEQLADPTGRGVHEGDVTRLHGIRAGGEVVRGQALEHHGRRGLEVDPLGHEDEHGCREGGEARGAAQRLRPGDAVTGGEPLDPFTGGDDRAGALVAADERGGVRVDALALVDVDEVDAGGG